MSNESSPAHAVFETAAPTAATLERLWRLWREGQRPEVRDFLAGAGELAPSQLAAVLLLDQRERWLIGERMPAEWYLALYPSLQTDVEYGVELVYGEFLLREELGEGINVEEYQRRFPQYAARLQVQLDLHRAFSSSMIASSQTNDASGSKIEDRRKPPLTDPPSSALHPLATTTSNLAGPAPSGPVVSGYRIDRELGRGGMSIAYKAWHLELKRPVALKMIRSPDYADAAAQKRFLAEAETIARLHHPNIVQIYEIGWHEARPYLALEFVAGGTLAAALNGTPQPARQAAQLLETLARAVHYAHENGIVHRDLKPANILLQGSGVRGQESGISGQHHAPRTTQHSPRAGRGSPDPAPTTHHSPALTPSPWPLTPKITDFGLAKQLDAETAYTESGAILGTPSYMAPEQAGGQNRQVSPATDVYALGVILYETLAGRPPFKAPTLLETLEQVRSAEPVSPRRLQPRLPRDLETICLKCLEKEPHKRYTSALALADELGRFVRNEPIRSRPIGFLARLDRWCRRKPALAAAIGLAAAALLIAAAVSINFGVHQYRAAVSLSQQRDQARENLRLADANFELARKAVDDYYTVVTEEPLLEQEKMRQVRKRLLEKALPLYMGFQTQRPEDPQIEAALASNYFRVASITAEIGRSADAIEAYKQAISIRERIVARFPDAAESQRKLATTYHNLGNLQADIGQGTAAAESHERARQILEELVAAHPEVVEYRFDLARSFNSLGSLQRKFGQPAAAARSYEKARQIQEKLVASHPEVAQYELELARTCNNLGLLQRELSQFAAATTSLDNARMIQEKLVASNPEPSAYQFELARTYNNLGILQSCIGRPAASLSFYSQARQIQEKLVAAQPEVTIYQKELANTCCNLGLLQQGAGEFITALKSYDRGVAVLAPLVLKHPGDAALQTSLIDLRLGRAGTLAYLGKHQEATGDAALVAEEKSLTGQNLYNLSCALSVASTAARKDEKLSSSERERRSDLYAARAVAVLARAHAAGFFIVRGPAEWMKKDKDLDPLRARTDFKQLLADIEAHLKPQDIKSPCSD
jgi:serine/threonine-protein kinase